MRNWIFFLVLGLSLVQAEVVINEVHYDPQDETEPLEFIEIYNNGSKEVDLSGWQLTDAVSFTFPANTLLPVGEFLVIGEDPGELNSEYGVSALGPWVGSLSNQGEEIDLRDSLGVLQDQVDYGVGFPWPTASRGAGGSMSLISPDLDNDLGGSWRTSGTNLSSGGGTYLSEADKNWRYRKGTSEASSPVDEWRELDFVEDGSWLPGQTPIGIGDGDDNTFLGDMQTNYTSVYLRREFEIPPGNVPQTLTLRLYVDDGAVVWINGVEVERAHVKDGFQAYDSTAINHEAEWEEFTIPNAGGFLNEGTNIIAIHAFNERIGSSDFSIDAELMASTDGPLFGDPSPGLANFPAGIPVPPAIRQVRHTPEEPGSGDDVVISARITDPEGMGTVSLDYQIVSPGDYIRKSDAEYETSWTSVTMSTAGDGVYSATLPAALQNHRQLVRYRIHFEDKVGAAETVPYADDEQGNFAYFVYDGLPGWTGSFTPSSADETFSPDLMDDVASYKLIANSTDVTNSQYSSGSDGVHMLGTFIYDGKVYDHIEFENRGEFSTYVSGKNKWRIHFNRARRFHGRDNWGEKYDRDWSTLNLQPLSSPWAAVNRGMAGLDEAVPFRLYELCGVPSPKTHYFSFRVIDEATEVHPTDQYRGDLWGLYMVVEQPTGSFLDERGLADGNVYKIESGSGDKKEQGDTQVTNSSDWTSFYSASNSAQTEQWWRDNMHMPTYYSMRALNRFTGNVDIRIGANHYFYHEPTQDQWHVIPWDLDMMFIAETHQAGHIRQQNALSHSALAREFRNRSRELLDLLGSDGDVAGGQIGQLLDEYAQIVNPTGQAKTWADVDANLWNYHPRTRGNPNTHSGQSNHKGNFYYSPYVDSRRGGTYTRTLVSEDHEGFVQHLLDYTTDTFSGGSWIPGNGVPAGYGYEYLKREANDASIPNRPIVTYEGSAGFPVDDLAFNSTDFSDGTGSFAMMRWRVARIAAPGLAGYVDGEPRSYEVETLFQSDDIFSFRPDYQFDPALLEPGNTYRVRVQHEDSTGRTSHWSEPVEFVAGVPSLAVLTDNLVISELMYHPHPAGPGELQVDQDDFEYLELKNVSDSVTVSLDNLSFTDGIEFDFSGSPISSLGPGECLLLVKNQAAFESRYGAGLPIAGVFDGRLSNGGERIILSYFVNTAVIDFSYSDDDPWPAEADGDGVALVLDDSFPAVDHGVVGNWSAGAGGGSPGLAEPECPTFSSWRDGRFTVAQLADDLVSGEQADPDGDLLTNLLEFALGTDPLVADRGVVEMTFVNDNGLDYAALKFPRLVCRHHLSYVVEWSEDLENWDSEMVSLETFSDQGDGTEVAIVRATTPLEGSSQSFMRLRVVESP